MRSTRGGPFRIEAVAALIEPVEVHFQWRPQTPDPNDEMVLETAVNGKADAVVTYNVADFAAAKRFFQSGSAL